MARRPLSFTEVLELGAPSDVVLDHMVHPETASTVDPTIVEWRCEDDPPRPGSLNHLKARFLFVRVPLTSRFAECDRPHRMVIEGVRPPMARWTRGVHDLEDIPGGMRYTYTVESRPPFGTRTIHRLVLRSMHRGVRVGCDRLREVFGEPRPT